MPVIGSVGCWSCVHCVGFVQFVYSIVGFVGWLELVGGGTMAPVECSTVLYSARDHGTRERKKAGTDGGSNTLCVPPPQSSNGQHYCPTICRYFGWD